MRFEGDWTPLSSAENMTIDANKQHFSKKKQNNNFLPPGPTGSFKKKTIFNPREFTVHDSSPRSFWFSAPISFTVSSKASNASVSSWDDFDEPILG